MRPGTPKHVLLVDDEPDITAALGLMLSGRYGLSFECAEDGETGLESALSSPPAAVFLDVAMPGIDGYETCRRLRREPALRGVPVILMTAYLDTDMKARAEHSGADRILTKPFDEAEMSRALTLVLDNEWRGRCLWPT